MKKILFISALLVVTILNAFSQDLPVYNQFYFNPYLYNPSFLTEEGLEFNLTYRKQWADVADAPQVAAFNMQYAGNSKFAYGLSLQSESSVVLNTNTAYFTLGYKIPFGFDHQLRFGLSLGAVQNVLDFDELTRTSDPSLLEDPAIINAVDNNYYFSSQFGINYQIHSFSLGVAFPKFFDNRVNSPERINSPTLDKLQNLIVTASYEFNINPDITLTPIALYRYVNKVQYQAELTGIFNYKELLSLGGGYRYQSGPIGYFGIQLNEKINFSYSYEVAGINSRSFGGATHEIHLRLNLKQKEKRIISKNNLDIQKNENNRDVEESSQFQVFEDSTNSDSNSDESTFKFETTQKDTTEVRNSIENRNSNEITNKTSLLSGISSGYYIIVGAFVNLNNAQNLSKMISEVDMKSYIVLNEENDLYYVHLLKTQSKSDARSLYNIVRNLPYFDFKDAWILHIE